MSQNLTDWLLEHYGREVMRPGLERMREALDPIFSTLKTFKVVTIAGTNGKGETTLRLSQKLTDRRHLVWTSPHIIRLTERFRSEKGEIDEEELKKLILSCHEDLSQRKISLSYYEFLFFVFCSWAVKVRPEFLLLEVGLGGRLDAVNVLDASIVLIPSISRDHQEILGGRYDQILAEKLGVLRPGSLLLSSVHLDYLKERTRAFVHNIQAEVFFMDDVKKWPLEDFSGRNELLAHAAFQVLNHSALKLDDWSPQRAPLESRGEEFRGKNHFIFFGSHNTDGLRKLIQFLHSGNYNFPRPPYDLIVLSFSRRETADLLSMLRMMKKANLGRVVVTAFDHPKALPKVEAQEISRQEGLDFVFDIEPLVQGKSDQKILVTGSYYFMSDFKHRFC